jgi:hypothetical protein
LHGTYLLQRIRFFPPTSKLEIIHVLRKPDVPADLGLEPTRPKVVALVSGKGRFVERGVHSDDLIFMVSKWTSVAEGKLSTNTVKM